MMERFERGTACTSRAAAGRSQTTEERRFDPRPGHDGISGISPDKKYDKVLLFGMSRTRVSITIPRDVLEAADRRAMELDLSRSRLVSEALRRYLSDDPGPGWPVAEALPAYRPGPGAARLEQLRSDLALTAEERVRVAEQTALVSELRAPPPQRDRVIGFERLEDFYAWERHEELRR